MPVRTVVLIALLAGCAPTRVPVPAAPPMDSQDGLTVTLVWAAPVDLDLYVTTPRGETVYYANPGPAFVGDATCASTGTAAGRERARWRMPVAGRYRVGVDFPESCTGAIDEAPYRVVVDVAGERREHEGTARRLVRDPAVLAVDVP